MMGETMCTPLFHNQFRVPTYEDWVDHEADWSHVYDFHEHQLQHLQSHHQCDRWVLKTGAHMWGLEHLLATYPDARIVFTHRDPVDSMTSYASLTSLVRTMGSDDVDRVEIARDWTARLCRVVGHALDVREARDYPEAIFYDMQFGDFVADQCSIDSLRQVRDNRDDSGIDRAAWKQMAEFGETTELKFNNPDWSMLAAAFGWHCQKVSNSRDLPAMLRAALDEPRPSLVIVPVDYRENMKLTQHLGEIVCPI